MDEQRERAKVEQRPHHEGIRGLAFDSLGLVWLLPSLGLDPSFEAEADQFYDDVILTERADPALVDMLAYCMLLINYKLTGAEVVAIIAGGDRERLVAIVGDNLLAIQLPDERACYTAWIRAALLANQIRPESIPAEDLAGVMTHLVGTGRALPHEAFTGAGRYQEKRQSIFGVRDER